MCGNIRIQLKRMQAKQGQKVKKTTRHKPVVFQILIADLRREGWTQQKIADKCGTSQATIQALGRGSRWEPMYETGARIVQLHTDICG